MINSNNKFGKYTLLKRIAVGGMAEVYRGRLAGEQGFEKPVVIKKMLPQIAADEEMVKFFIDEARLAALLQHENIVHIYDFGELEGSYFLAMEFLLGQDLNNLLTQAINQKKPMSLENILWIASKICDGLEYAHTLKDLKGRPLNLIHRDLSPHNVFVTYDGKVKILDFGIAKTAMQSTKTRVGAAKGKMAYMSPEQIEAKTIDHRSDIFAIGIILYEMVTQSQMYTGDTTVEIFKQVMDAEFEPPEKRNPDLDPSLVAIIKKALQKDPSERFQTCSEMQSSIEECIFHLSLRPSPKMLSEYVVTLFPDAYAKSQSETLLEEEDIITDESSGAGTMMMGEATATVATQRTEVLVQKTEIIEKVDETTVLDTDVQKPTQPSKAGIPNFGKRLKQWITQSKMHLATSITVISLLIMIPIIGFQMSKAEPTSNSNQLVSKRSISEEELVLIRKAEACIKNNQLTTPEHDCSKFYYDEILKVAPDSEEVKKGYEKIASKYADLAQNAKNQFKFDTARTLTAKGLELDPDNERLLNLELKLSMNKPGLFLSNIRDGINDAIK